MPLIQLSSNPKLSVGVKQTTKVLSEGRALRVYIARDAEQHVVRQILKLAEEHSVEVEYVDLMKELGKACGIDVGAATAVIEK
ncbi:MAG: large subunit ribosomal protein [Clostridiales bacterium]|jgi:large subunit ribosomal protein L7A|nr:large subunit ribosomal protein [Clostridiales bacterium]